MLLAQWAGPVTGLPIPGPSVTPGAGVEGGQVAIGEFYSPLPDRKGFSAFFIGVVRGGELDDDYASVGAHMLLFGETCRVIKLKPRKSKDGTKRQRYILRCNRFEHEGEIPPGDFEMDPLLLAARLQTEVEGSPIDVTWTGEGNLPTGGAGIGFYEEGSVEGGGSAGKWASAEGTIFGHPVRSSDAGFCFSFSAIFEGAGGYGHVGALADDFEVPRRASGVSSEGVRSGACG